MKLFLSTLFVAAMAATLQAVTVAWTLANSRWIYEGNTEGKVTNWTGVGATTGPTLDVYVFFSTKDLTAAQAAGAVPSGQVTANDQTTENVTVGTAIKVGSSNYGTSQVGSSTLNVTAELTGGTGYYYMVIFNGNNTTAGTENYSYAVAKTTQITGSNPGQGVYDLTVGTTTPDAMEFVELNWMAGSTWGAPLQTPEPTALALLALGVAGLALRRKNA